MEDRIKKIRKHFGLKQSELAERIGVKAATITSYETGLRAPSDTVVISICRELGVREEWLRTGEGDMLLPVSEDDELMQALAYLQVNEKDPVRDLLIAYWKLPENEKAVIWKLITAVSEKKQKEKPEP